MFSSWFPVLLCVTDLVVKYNLLLLISFAAEVNHGSSLPALLKYSTGLVYILLIVLTFLLK